MGVGNHAVLLDRHGDLIESYEVMNYVRQESGGMDSVPVSVYNSSSMQYIVHERTVVVWPGSTTVVPVDYVREVCDFAPSIYL